LLLLFLSNTFKNIINETWIVYKITWSPKHTLRENMFSINLFGESCGSLALALIIFSARSVFWIQRIPLVSSEKWPSRNKQVASFQSGLHLPGGRSRSLTLTQLISFNSSNIFSQCAHGQPLVSCHWLQSPLLPRLKLRDSNLKIWWSCNTGPRGFTTTARRIGPYETSCYLCKPMTVYGLVLQTLERSQRWSLLTISASIKPKHCPYPVFQYHRKD
jgi:hypothetical protein